MKTTQKQSEALLREAVLERPIGFSINDKHYCLYPPSLGKTLLIAPIMQSLGIDEGLLQQHLYLEILRLLDTHREEIAMILAYHSLQSKQEIFNGPLLDERQQLIANLDDAEIAQLFVATLSWTSAQQLIAASPLSQESRLRERIAHLKQGDGKQVVFGGKTLYGALIDRACQRYGWSMDYVVWGISLTNLQMLLSDTVDTVYLTKDEARKVHLPSSLTGQPTLCADDPQNAERIRSLFKDA